MSKNLANLIAEASIYNGSWQDAPLAWEIDTFLWVQYPRDSFDYKSVEPWDKLLQKTMDDNSYDKLSEVEVLSILFGLHCRNRIFEELWCVMFERGVTQKLLERILGVNV